MNVAPYLPWLQAGGLSEPELVLLATAVVLCALTGIAWVDFRSWEIDPWLCVAAALASAVVIQIDGGWAEALLGAALGTGLAAAIHRFRRKAIGEGDIWLYGMCGLIVGINGLPAWALLNAATSFLLIACLARKRRRPMRRCTIPAALAACPAAAVVLLVV